MNKSHNLGVRRIVGIGVALSTASMLAVGSLGSQAASAAPLSTTTQVDACGSGPVPVPTITATSTLSHSGRHYQGTVYMLGSNGQNITYRVSFRKTPLPAEDGGSSGYELTGRFVLWAGASVAYTWDYVVDGSAYVHNYPEGITGRQLTDVCSLLGLPG